MPPPGEALPLQQARRPPGAATPWEVVTASADLAADDPLRREWDLVVSGPRFAAALVAGDRYDRGPEARRGFDVVVTHDRDLVIRAAEPLLRRLVPEP
jgi:DICT domain-containing protein